MTTKGEVFFDTDPSFEAIDDLCKNSLLALSVSETYIVAQDIYNKAGTLLLKQGDALDAQKRDLLLRHELRDRFLNSVSVGDEIGLEKIPEQINAIFNASLSDLKEDFAMAMHEMDILLHEIDFSSAIQTNFELLKRRHALAYSHSFLTTLILLRMAILLDYDYAKKTELLAAGLFHHLGYGTLEDASQSSAFLTLKPTEYQKKIILIHPQWTYKLLQTLNQISEEDQNSTTFVLPKVALEGIFLHHRGADGKSGYGGTGVPNEIARMLDVVNTFRTLLETGLTAEDALKMIKGHAGKVSGNGLFMGKNGVADDSKMLFDNRYSDLLATIFTRPLQVQIQKEIRYSSELPSKSSQQLFVEVNRILRELGELNGHLVNCLKQMENLDSERIALKQAQTHTQRMIHLTIAESGLFGPNPDQLQGLFKKDQLGHAIAAIQPTFYQLENRIARINGTIDEILQQRGNEECVDLSVIQASSLVLSAEISKIYDGYLQETRTRRLEYMP